MSYSAGLAALAEGLLQPLCHDRHRQPVAVLFVDPRAADWEFFAAWRRVLLRAYPGLTVWATVASPDDRDQAAARRFADHAAMGNSLRRMAPDGAGQFGLVLLMARSDWVDFTAGPAAVAPGGWLCYFGPAAPWKAWVLHGARQFLGFEHGTDASWPADWILGFAQRNPVPQKGPRPKAERDALAAWLAQPVPAWRTPREWAKSGLPATTGPHEWRSLWLDAVEAQRLARTSGVWGAVAAATAPPPVEYGVTPPHPPRSGHLALILAAGGMNGIMGTAADARRFLLRGGLVKTRVTETDADGAQVTRDVYRPTLRLLHARDGMLQDLLR